MLRKDVIQPSTIQWASGITMVTKKDVSKRICADYHNLNDATVKEAYALIQLMTLLAWTSAQVTGKCQLRSQIDPFVSR